jgi:TRAP-type C4-dicarboxylate transport system substrate-binding protein
MGWANVDQVFEFFYKFGMLKWQREVLAEKNIFYAAPLPASPLPIMSNFPFRKVADIKGKKVWSIGSTAAYVRNLGGAPTTFPPSELYMGLKLGTIDGMIYSMAELETSNYKEVVKYINWPAVIDPLCVQWLINLKSWKDLPPDIQKTIEDTLVEIGPSLAKKYLAEDYKGVEAAKKVGVQEIQMEAGEIPIARQAAAKVWSDFAGRSPRTAQTIQMLKDYLATKGIKVE